MVTREEEIFKGTQQFVGEYLVGLHDAETLAKKCAQWADEHPKSPWISTEERLPNELVKDGERLYYSSEVFVRYEEIYEGQQSPTVKYDWDRVFFTTCKPEWQKHNCKEGMRQQVVTHWMPIPQIEKGE